MFSFFRFLKLRRNKDGGREIAPDEIFLDSSNLPDFDVHQFEGRFEKPISKRTIFFLGAVFVFVGMAFVWRVWSLQIAQGEVYRQKSENNRLDKIPIFAERGIIYDRNKTELAWNEPQDNVFPRRVYTGKEGFSHILGYVVYPKKDAKGFYYRTELAGRDGVERKYNKVLAGKNGEKIIETDALMNILSESVIKHPQDGEPVTLTIDERVQNALFGFIKDLSYEKGFVGGAGVLMDVKTGDVIALASYPEYDSAILSDGSNRAKIRAFQTDPAAPFLNRAISGLYTPGSIVKPFVALAALNEKVITPEKQILSTGSISLPNPYYPELKSVFTDWKAHGWVDVRRALAVSSNVYFYEVGGGYKDQNGLGIRRIREYIAKFGIGEKTGVDLPGEVAGVVPGPEWKKEHFNGEPWRVGDTYNTAIGQYGFQVTPIQMVRAVAAIATDGMLPVPHLAARTHTSPADISDGIDSRYFTVVKEGMRQAVLEGTAKGLNVPFVKVAAKTGTAEVGISKRRVNSWILGFYPYDNPRYAFVVVMEKGPRENTIGGLYVMRRLLEWMRANTPEYLSTEAG